MKLIIGGAYQGKLAYAKETYKIIDGWVDGSLCQMEEIEDCKGIYQFHEYVKRMILQESDAYALRTDHLINLEEQAEHFVEKICKKNPDLLVISNELGYGVVPVEKKDRLWREAVGRMCTCIAAKSDEVVRVVCGVGMRLK